MTPVDQGTLVAKSELRIGALVNIHKQGSPLRIMKKAPHHVMLHAHTRTNCAMEIRMMHRCY